MSCTAQLYDSLRRHEFIRIRSYRPKNGKEVRVDWRIKPNYKRERGFPLDSIRQYLEEHRGFKIDYYTESHE